MRGERAREAEAAEGRSRLPLERGGRAGQTSACGGGRHGGGVAGRTVAAALACLGDLLVLDRGLLRVPSSGRHGDLISSLQPSPSPPAASAFPSHLPFSSPPALSQGTAGFEDSESSGSLGRAAERSQEYFSSWPCFLCKSAYNQHRRQVFLYSFAKRVTH